MFKNVLLPIDLNHEASWSKSLPMAVRMVGDGGTLHLLGIVHDLGAGVVASFLPDGFEQKAMERLKADLSAFADDHVPAGTASAVHVGHGHVPETILRNGDALDADLIVMASHPPDDLTTMLVGSNADKVVRHANRPVLVVRG